MDVQRCIDAMLDHANIDLRDKADRRGHIVYRYAFRGPVEVPDRPYDRGCREFRWKSIRYELQAWHGLPEFDTLSIDTELSFAILAGLLKCGEVRRVVVWEPGHGHIPVFLSKAMGDSFELRVPKIFAQPI